jgi:multimeric flavodoxin WrbA
MVRQTRKRGEIAMKVLVLLASPNTNGLTAACGEAAKNGAEQGGAEATVVNLNKLKIDKCHSCDNGWGTCNKTHECQVQDDFQDTHASAKKSDAIVLVSPVYWGEMSESAKAFTDRLRRCEATRGDESALKAKPIICVAAAGGSGNGCMTCLSSMERLVDHVRGRKFDLIGITRNSREHKLEAIAEAAKKMAKEAV